MLNVKAWWKYDEKDPREVWRYSEIDDNRYETRLVAIFIDGAVAVSYRYEPAKWGKVEIGKAYLVEGKTPDLGELQSYREHGSEFTYEYISSVEFEEIWKRTLRKLEHWETWLQRKGLNTPSSNGARETPF